MICYMELGCNYDVRSPRTERVQLALNRRWQLIFTNPLSYIKIDDEHSAAPSGVGRQPPKSLERGGRFGVSDAWYRNQWSGSGVRRFKQGDAP